MAEANGGNKNLAAGIKLLHEEMKGVRSDIAASLRDAAEDRRRADRRFEASERRWEFMIETIREERKQSDRQARLLVQSVLQVGRRIIGKLDEQSKKMDEQSKKMDDHSKKLDEQTSLLKGIQKGMNGHPRGRKGNGNR